MSPDQSAREGVGELVYIGARKEPQAAAQSQSEAVPGVPAEYLEIPEDRRLKCASCSTLCVRRATWGKLPESIKRLLGNAGIKRIGGRELCRTCYEQVCNSGSLDEFPKSDWIGKVKEKAARGNGGWKSLDVPAIWAEVQLSGGGHVALGERLGVTRQRASQILDELGLPKGHSLKARAAVFLEELEFLAGAGEGVYAISRALQMDPDALVKKVDHLHQTGKTTVRFDGWSRRYDKEQAA